MEYFFELFGLEKLQSENGLDGVLISVHWAYYLRTETPAIRIVRGITYLDAPDVEAFTPFDELTKEQIIGWLETKLDIVALQERLVYLSTFENQPDMLPAVFNQ
jgi:hypothetical protein